ncbi:odorant receptor Or1-like [Chelonus insularis]|uniref:odorant receptor Or1-like n=1 Tax=Chelonus insularis TaxID=460826 RepID=UPI00158B9597|nr:odorant receptor Or1-like [Chelonus insularis]
MNKLPEAFRILMFIGLWKSNEDWKTWKSFVEIAVILFHTNKVYEGHREGSLPFKVWYPYDTSNIYLFTFYQQIITVFLSANVNVAFDVLLVGMMMHICLQVNILKYRFRRMLNDVKKYSLEKKETFEKITFSEYVTFHSSILRLVSNLTEIFSQTMFVQFGSSASILCTSMYVLSQTPVFTSDFLACFLYISCMFCQIFFPCLIGHQMTLEFANLNDAMYNTNWYAVSNNFRKCMNIIMIKSSKPILFSSGYVISLSLDVFKSLLKLSYSIFNVFQQAS